MLVEKTPLNVNRGLKSNKNLSMENDPIGTAHISLQLITYYEPFRFQVAKKIIGLDKPLTGLSHKIDW